MVSNNALEFKFHELADFYPMQDPARFHELVEGMRQSGYRDEFPIVLYEGKILDGRNRYRAALEAGVEPFIVQFSGEDPVEFVIQANSNRRDLEPGQRVAILDKIRTKYPKVNLQYQEHLSPVTNAKDSRKEFAKKAGVSTGTVAMVDFTKKHAPALFEKIARGELPAKTAYKQAKGIVKLEQQTELVKLAETVPASDRWNIFQGDISKVRLEPGSIDAIFTDPPYPKDCLPLWGELAKFAKHHLKPGGVLLAMTGNLYIPDILAMLGEHLTYQWQLACTLPGQHSEVHAAWVNNQMWKPILVYRNGGDLVNIGSDLFQNEGKDKDFHVWGQGVDGYRWQIEHFTKPNDLICDPFLGGGTTAVAALQLKRRFVGFDVEPEKVAISKGRLAELREE
jgi:hypothetical protein